MPLSGPYPYGEEAAIAEVAAVARGRRDLLARFAGTCLGLSVMETVDQLAGQKVAQASLAARAGADMDLVARWIPAGVKRGDPVVVVALAGYSPWRVVDVCAGMADYKRCPTAKRLTLDGPRWRAQNRGRARHEDGPAISSPERSLPPCTSAASRASRLHEALKARRVSHGPRSSRAGVPRRRDQRQGRAERPGCQMDR
jgi:hypothetical protein